MCIDLMEILANDMNFNVRIFKRFDGKWASKDPNSGVWNGMASNIISGDADIILTSLGLTLGRYEVLDFMDPMGDIIYAFAIKSECDISMCTMYIPVSYTHLTLPTIYSV